MDMNRLIAEMTDADEEVRAAARDELAMLMDDEVARAFLDIITSDAGEQIRGDAIIGLGPIIEEAGIDYSDDVDYGLPGDFGPGITRETFQQVTAALRGLYEDEKQPKLIRRRAFEVLVRDPQTWQADEIRRHLGSDDPQWKVTAIFGMGYVAGFEKEIAETLETADGSFLYEAVRAAGAMDVETAAKKIRELATSDATDRDLRLVAIEALPNVDPDSQDLLLKLTRSTDEEIAETAQAALDDLDLRSQYEDEEEE